MKTFRLWDLYLALVALVVVATGFILALVLYGEVFSTATDVIVLAGGCLTAAYTFLVAYLAIAVHGDRAGGKHSNPGPRIFPLSSSLTGILRTLTSVVLVALQTGKILIPAWRRGGPRNQDAYPQDRLPKGERNGDQSGPSQTVPSGPSQTFNIYDLRKEVVEPAAKAADSATIAVAPVIAALAGFVGALIPLAYPAGLIALWIQLSEHFEYRFYEALFAASLARSAMVVGKVIWILVFSLFSALLPMWIWYAYARAKVNKSFEENGLRRFRLLVVWFFGLYTSALFVLLRVFTHVRSSFLFWPLITLVALTVLFGGVIVVARIRRREFQRVNYKLVIVLILSIAFGLLLARVLTGLGLVEASFRPDSRLPLVQAFLCFTVAEILGGAILFYRGLWQAKRVEEDKPRNEEQRQDTQEGTRRDEDKRQDAREAARAPLYLGLAVVYVGSVAAGVCLAGLQSPSLPTVSLTVKHSKAVKEMEAGLLSNTGSYWYVVDYCNKEEVNRFLVIPNTSVEESDAIVEEPSTLEGGGAGMDCPPETTIKSGRSGTVATAVASFKFRGDDDRTANRALKFECRIDGTGYKSCTSPKGYSHRERPKPFNGEHTFWVRAKDEIGNVDETPAKRTWTVDTIGPETAIDYGRSGTIASKNPSFTFSSPERGAAFQCKIDKNDYKSCLSRKGYLMLSQGFHTFKVRAQDALKNVDATPPARKFTVDTVSPETTIKSGPSGTVGSGDVQLTFTSDEPSTFKCKIDGTEYQSCPSPMNYFGLLDGEHTFWVRAKDEAGNVEENPAKRTWTVCRATDQSLRL